MNTKRYYIAPTMEAVKIESVTLLAGSGEFGLGATVNGRDPLIDEDPYATTP